MTVQTHWRSSFCALPKSFFARIFIRIAFALVWPPTLLWCQWHSSTAVLHPIFIGRENSISSYQFENRQWSSRHISFRFAVISWLSHLLMTRSLAAGNAIQIWTKDSKRNSDISFSLQPIHVTRQCRPSSASCSSSGSYSFILYLKPGGTVTSLDPLLTMLCSKMNCTTGNFFLFPLQAWDAALRS